MDGAVESLRCVPGTHAHPNKVVIYARTTKPGGEEHWLLPGIPGDVGTRFENLDPEL